MNRRARELDLLPERFAISRFEPERDLPVWVRSSAFVAITRTPVELSVVCHETAVPSTVEAKRGFRCFGVRGPLDFSEIGILASLTQALAEGGISLFAISTYDTDYLLVEAESLDRAVRALREAGHVVHEASSDGP